MQRQTEVKEGIGTFIFVSANDFQKFRQTARDTSRSMEVVINQVLEEFLSNFPDTQSLEKKIRELVRTKHPVGSQLFVSLRRDIIKRFVAVTPYQYSVRTVISLFLAEHSYSPRESR